MSEYIKPALAFKKLDAAKIIRQHVYIYGSSGFGKTELIRQYFRNQRYIYVLCQNNSCDLSHIPESGECTVAIDNINSIESAELRSRIISLLGRRDLWVILSGRSKMPSWLFESYIRRSMMVITEEDIALDQTGIDRYMRSEGLILSEEELQYQCRCTHGNLIGVKFTAQSMLAGNRLSEELCTKNLDMVLRYFEESVLSAMSSEVVDLLVKVSISDSFTENLAAILTGNSAVLEVIERALDFGNFIEKSGDVYTIREEFLLTLRKKAVKEYTPDELRQYAMLAGAYYETNGQDNKALELYSKYQVSSRIKELLVRNSRRNVESGYLIEMKKYYLMLSDEEIASSIYLMSGVSLVYSILMDFEKSEYWYGMLKKYKNSARGESKREAVRQLAYLDISLPGRGSRNILDKIRSCYKLLSDNSIPMPEFSVTSNQPSLMNGGKDFCEWSKHDREIAAVAGKMICTFLGKYGRGLVNASLAESFFEKGGDPYEVLSLCSSARIEAETGGKLELRFAATAVMIRQHLLLGNPDTAKDILCSFERNAKAEKMRRILVTIDALRCRIALMEHDEGTVEQWLTTAPDENECFIALERYRYLTKIRCYIGLGEFERAYSLIASMRYYAEKCDRKYISMEVALLEAIVRYRRGDDWRNDFVNALAAICEYRFVPMISREGAAIYDLLRESGEQCAADRRINQKWLERVVEETGRVARRYPLYLKSDHMDVSSISPMDIRILCCLADGLSVQKASDALGIKFETLRSRIKELYRKMGAKNKTEAVMLAREMKLI